MSIQLKTKLYDVISGKSEVRYGEAIQAIAHYLRQSHKTSSESKGSKRFKEEEKQRLDRYMDAHTVLGIRRCCLHKIT
jgi:hypothetical protein